ncbi:protein terminal ear1 [Cornus florida]|uniref:protein terminal ear1 n=1 Tax=Cornus florida TaxID=4283 RepID=UPI0028A2625C|nr:protein terminal ear1 [Cornus florida]
MAAAKGLNPEASAYIPRSLQSFLSTFPTLPPITTHCCYFSPPPPPPRHGGAYNYYPTLSSSSFYDPLPLYTADSFPPLSPAAEEEGEAETEAPPSPTVLIKEQEVGVYEEGIRRTSTRKGFRRSGFWRKVGGKREGCGGSDDGRQQAELGFVNGKDSRGLLLKFLDQHCMAENEKINKFNPNEETEEQTVSAFDFLYLPMDFKTGCNKGYAFVNFTEAKAVWKFYQAFHNKAWDFFQSPKIREIVCAKIQGKEALVDHFEKSTFRCDTNEFLPVCFSPARDGSGKWVKQSLVGERI